MLRTLKFQLPTIFWAIFVLVLCGVPQSSFRRVPVFPGIDKLVHTGFFFVFTVFLFFGYIRQHQTYSYRIATVIGFIFIAAVFGVGIELLQLKVFTGRSADWWDFFADMTGVWMAVFGYVLLHRTKNDEKYK